MRSSTFVNEIARRSEARKRMKRDIEPESSCVCNSCETFRDSLFKCVSYDPSILSVILYVVVLAYLANPLFLLITVQRFKGVTGRDDEEENDLPRIPWLEE